MFANGDSLSFRYSLSGSYWQWYIQSSSDIKVASSITDDKVKCLYLFQCFMEAQNNTMCEKLGSIVETKQIDFSGQTMLAADLGI